MVTAEGFAPSASSSRNWRSDLTELCCVYILVFPMENLMKVLDAALPVDLEQAHRAWRTYNRLMAILAEKHEATPSEAAGVFAALSPNNDYFGNLRDARTMLRARAAGMDMDSFKVSTYGSNKRKAWAILSGKDPLALIVAPKTRSFYLNIVDPEDPEPVTVDGHIFNAWTGKRVPLTSSAQKLNRRLYAKIADEIRRIGRDRGLLPNVVQGAIWFCWRRMHGIKTTGQLEFWNPEAHAVGLEYVPFKAGY